MDAIAEVRVGGIDSFLEEVQGQYANKVTESKVAGYRNIKSGNTGLVIQDTDRGWRMDFKPEGVADPAKDKRGKVINGYLFVWAMDGVRQWYSGSQMSNKSMVIEQHTNSSMHDFRAKIFGELSREAGVDGIYEDVAKLGDDRFVYRLDIAKFADAVNKLETTRSVIDLEQISYFKRLNKARQYWSSRS